MRAVPSDDRRARAVVLAAVLAAAVVVALVLGGRALDDGDGGPTGSGPDGASAQPEEDDAPATPEQVEAVVAELSDAVAEARGRPFLAPVEVELLEGEAFVQRLLEGLTEEDGEELAQTGRALIAMGLLEPGTDLEAVVRAAYGQGTLGFYDAETGTLVVRGSAITTSLRSTIVHELVHALDDQHFELHRPEVADADDERSLGLAALIEGNATRVQQAWEAELSGAERAALAFEQLAGVAGAGGAGIPPIVAQQLSFPYLAGPAFVDALLDEGGEARVDQAFAAPPATSEQILHPETYLRGEQARPVPVPAADGEPIDQGTYGQLMVLLTLADELGQEAAQEAAEGWGGDAYVAWEEGDATCVRATFQMDAPRDLRELAAAWEAWAAAHDDADVATGAQAVTVTACG